MQAGVKSEYLSRFHGTRLDHADAHVALNDLLAQRLAKGVDASLDQGVDAIDDVDLVRRRRADVDQAGDAARVLLGVREEKRPLPSGSVSA